jgi:hypothetical protein
MSREEYYVFQKEYYELEELRRLVESRDSEKAMKYFVDNRLNCNAYMRSADKSKTFVPLIFKTLEHEQLHTFSLFLIKSGARIKAQPDGEPGDCMDLLFTCHSRYTAWLVKKGVACKHPVNGIVKSLLIGGWDRLQELIRHGAISTEQIHAAYQQRPELPYQMIKTGIHYLTFFYTQAIKMEAAGGVPPSLKAETDKTIGKYSKTFELYRPAVTGELVQLCVDYYLYEILCALGITESPNAPVYNQKGTMSSIMRPLLNDARYERTCIQLNTEPSLK